MAISTPKPKLKQESDSDSDDSDDDLSFAQDMEALRRACLLPEATNPNPKPDPSTYSISDSDTDSSDNDDIELVKSVHRMFNDNEPLDLRPLQTLPPIGWSDDEDSSDEEDDYETLRAIERRFANYTPSVVKNTETVSNEPEVVHGTTILEQETSCSSSVHRNDANSLDGGCHDPEEAFGSSLPLISSFVTGPLVHPFGSDGWNQQEASKTPTLPSKYSGFSNPKSAHFLIDAIKKNRSFQKLIRNKLLQIEVRIEENKKMKEHVKTLKDYQVVCKRKAAQSLSQKKDDRVKLISAYKLRNSSTSKVKDKKAHALRLGPVENAHAANYRMVMERFPCSLRRERWSDEEMKNLGMGIKQQFQEMLLQKSLERYSDPTISSGDSTTFDDILTFITDYDISPEDIRKFLPKVDWKKLASLYVPGRSGEECRSRWLNHEDPLINHNQWKKCEDKELLSILQQRGIHNWIDISTKMKTNRTPYQCLARYQRSLNSNILKREWTEDDDDQLTAAVKAFGEKDWQLVVSSVEGRTNSQCSNRWMKTLSPARQKVGKWSIEEDVHLKVAVMLFGQKTWNKIQQFVLGRTQVQCRERWVNVLDHSIKLGEWTKEEDSRLKAAAVEYDYCWSKVAKAVPRRTDNQCWRRWTFLHPQAVPVLQAARRLRRTALISNFVAREEDRPSLGPSDFLPFLEPSGLIEAEKGNNNKGEKDKKRGKPNSKRKKRKQDEAFEAFLGDDVTSGGDDVVKKKKFHPRRSKRIKKCTSDIQEAVDVEDTTLFSLLKKTKRRSRPDSKQQPLETIDDETMPLASFLSKKVRRKLNRRIMNGRTTSQKDQAPSLEANILLASFSSKKLSRKFNPRIMTDQTLSQWNKAPSLEDIPLASFLSKKARIKLNRRIMNVQSQKDQAPSLEANIQKHFELADNQGNQEFIPSSMQITPVTG